LQAKSFCAEQKKSEEKTEETKAEDQKVQVTKGDEVPANVRGETRSNIPRDRDKDREMRRRGKVKTFLPRELAKWQRDSFFPTLWDDLVEDFFDRTDIRPFESLLSDRLYVLDQIPDIDISRTKDAYIISAEVPGISKENLHLDINQATKTLSLRAEKKAETSEEDATDRRYFRKERVYGRYATDITLPEDAELSKVSANYNHGVLQVTLPRMKQAETTIPVSIG